MTSACPGGVQEEVPLLLGRCRGLAGDHHEGAVALCPGGSPRPRPRLPHGTCGPPTLFLQLGVGSAGEQGLCASRPRGCGWGWLWFSAGCSGTLMERVTFEELTSIPGKSIPDRGSSI